MLWKKLRLAAGGEEKGLAYVDAVGVADGGVGAGDARSVGGVAKLGLGDLGEGVTRAHGELYGDTGGRDCGGEVKLGAGDDVVGIKNAGIGGAEVVPAETLAEILRG